MPWAGSCHTVYAGRRWTPACHGADVPVLCPAPALSWSSPCPHGDNWYDPAHGVSSVLIRQLVQPLPLHSLTFPHPRVSCLGTGLGLVGGWFGYVCAPQPLASVSSSLRGSCHSHDRCDQDQVRWPGLSWSLAQDWGYEMTERVWVCIGGGLCWRSDPSGLFIKEASSLELGDSESTLA